MVNQKIAGVVTLLFLVLVPSLAHTSEVEVWDWHLPRIEVYQKYADLYEQETGTKVVINQITGDFAERMTTALISGVLPDLVQFHPRFIGAFHEHMAQWPKDLFDVYDWGGDLIGIEWWLDDDQMLRYLRMVVSARLIYYNEDMWEQAGLHRDPLEYSRTWTWTDLTNDAKKLTRIDDSGAMAVSGFSFDPRLLFYDFYMQLGGRVYSQDGATTALNDHYGEVLRVAQLISDFYHVEGISGSPSSFQERTAAIRHDGPWLDSTYSAVDGLNYGVMFNPTPDGVWSPYGYNAGDFSLAVFSSLPDERKDAAFKFLSWMMNKDEVWLDYGIQHSAPPTLRRVWGGAELAEVPLLRVVMEAAPYTVPIADDPTDPRSAIDRLGTNLAARELSIVAAVERAIHEFNVGMQSVAPVKAVEYTYEQPPLPAFQR